MVKKVEVSGLEDCNNCGHGLAIVETIDGNANFLFDEDKIECKACGHIGQIAVTGDYTEDCIAYAVWNDPEEKLPETVLQSLREVS
ncbi:MAG: hypothetical protein JNJ93_04295 [Acinetobacter sp.]|nr:hypothetical protein [Acinetobacter sp.]